MKVVGNTPTSIDENSSKHKNYIENRNKNIQFAH